MKFFKALSKLGALLFSVLFFAFVLQVAGFNPMASLVGSVGVNTLMYYVPTINGVAYDATTIIFAKHIEDHLFPDDAFYMHSKDDSVFLDGKTVRYPVAGAKPNTEKNRATIPATVSKRTDGNNDYDIDEFTTDPIVVQDTENVVLSYDKLANIMSDHINTLNEEVADNFANIWLPNGADNIVRTTGAARAASLTDMGATGQRLAVAKADFVTCRERLNRMNAPKNDRYALIDSAFDSDILKLEDFTSAEKLGYSNIPDGVIGRAYGFWIYERSFVGAFDNAGTPVKKAVGATITANDNAAALFWSASMVNRAKGSVKAFIDQDAPTMYGTVLSALVRAGGKIRSDKKGVIALVEGTP